ncbi:MAG: tetratricopeptide repeat protein, partial [Planctomycetota bacterium]
LAVGTWLRRNAWTWVPFTAWAIYLVTMLPSLGVTDVFFWRYSYAGDHYVYQSLPALLVLFAWLGTHLAARLPSLHVPLCAVGLLAGVIMGAVSHQRAFIYRSEAAIWRETLEKNSASSLALTNLAALEYLAGRTAQGLALTREALSLRPDMYEDWLTLGNMLSSKRQWGEALDAYKRAINHAPHGTRDSLLAQVGYVVALYQLGWFEDAYSVAQPMRAALQPWESSPPDEEWVRLFIRLSVYESAARSQSDRSGAVPPAKSEFDHLLRRYPAARHELAVVYEELGQPGLALKLLEACLAESPSDVDLLMSCGRAARVAGKPERAIEVLERAERLRSDSPAVHDNLGQAYFAAGETEKAVEHYRVALHLSPGDPQIHLNLALACAAIGRWNEAVSASQQVRELRSTEFQGLVQLAWVLAGKSPFEEQLSTESFHLAHRACELTGWRQPRALDCLAAACASLGHFEEAVNAMDRALQLARAQGAGAGDVASMERRRSDYVNGKPHRTESHRAAD